MENQPPTKRRREEAAPGSMELEDRISQLPEPILQNHILSLLPQNDAVRTCTLSKSWRHLGLTRPKFEFKEYFFPGKKHQFRPVLENILQRYDDQNLSIQEFLLWMGELDPESISFLNKWIPKVIMNMGVKTFHFSAYDFTLPPVVFQAEFLTELDLKGCDLDQIDSFNVKLLALRRLTLYYVGIEEETFEKIMSKCPLIEHLGLDSCFGLNTIKVNNAPNLKHFDCQINIREEDKIEMDYCIMGSIEMNDTPSLETIRIEKCQNWLYRLHDNYFFPRLKSLYLWNVHLPTESLKNLSSNNCPSLEDLELHYCHGYKELTLSNRSIKRLIIIMFHPLIKVDIDAANILYFEYRSSTCIPPISFATTSSEWKSHIHVWGYTTDPNAWYLVLYEFLKALSQSQISLYTSDLPWTYFGGICEPVVVDHLCLSKNVSSYELPSLFHSLFRICRPMYIRLSLSATNLPEKNQRQLAESIRKTLAKKKGETRQCNFWHQDLEESSIQVSDKNANEWRAVQVVEFSNNEEIRFRLKWRDLS